MNACDKLLLLTPLCPGRLTVQSIRNLSFSKEPRMATEAKYGNKVASWEIENPGATAEVTMKFDCTRLEIKTDLAAVKSEGKDKAGSFEVFRKADKLVLVDD